MLELYSLMGICQALSLHQDGTHFPNAISSRGPRTVRRLHALRQAPVEEFVIERGSGFLPGRFEVLPGAGQVAGAAVEVAEGRVVQVIVPQRRIPACLLQHANARLRTFDLGHDDRAVEQVHRRALLGEQGVVEAQDRRPVGVGKALRRAMVAGDRRLQVERGDYGPLGRPGEELLRPADQVMVPLAAVLFSGSTHQKPPELLRGG
jgi:hypothetical protein